MDEQERRAAAKRAAARSRERPARPWPVDEDGDPLVAVRVTLGSQDRKATRALRPVDDEPVSPSTDAPPAPGSSPA